MLVVAFDGLLFNTLEYRARAIVEAMHHESLTVSTEQALAALPSRSIAEAVREIQGNLSPLAADIDETTLDLVVLRADRALAGLASSGASLNVKLGERIRRAASITRIVLRADSRRREVDELLRLTELDALVAMTRCSDDAANVHRSELNDSTLRRSYDQIVTRMAANRNLLGNASGIGIALELTSGARETAREFGFQAPDNFESAAFPGA